MTGARDTRIAMTARPPFKWAGGKTRLLPEILTRLPAEFNSYHEPFVGGGALFWKLVSTLPYPCRCFLSDMNPYLIATYRAIRDDVEDVIALLKTMPYQKEFYVAQVARQRDGTIIQLSDVQIGAWFLYINRSCFNGLWRVNKSGAFNVPFGKYTNPTICDADLLRACSDVLAQNGTVITQTSFDATASRFGVGDLVYFDPPYLPLSETSDFTAYTSGGFGLKEHVKLRDLALTLKQRGVHVIVSNSDMPAIRELYREGFVIETIMAARSINSKSDGRGKIAELIIR
jgi:DNA adenine methylase